LPDFEMGYREELQRAYPTQAAAIRALTRAKFVRRATAK
jgi:hypothetical protein